MISILIYFLGRENKHIPFKLLFLVSLLALVIRAKYIDSQATKLLAIRPLPLKFPLERSPL